MNNFSNYYCLVVLFFFRITACKANNSNTTVKEMDDPDVPGSADDVSGSADDVSGSDLKFDPDVCGLPIDEGDCRNESLGTNEDSGSDNGTKESLELNDLNESIELKEIVDLNELNELNRKELNESNKLYFGYNKSRKKCEQFNYNGCGGNENRFESINECRKTCYTPLKNFLAKATDLLVFRVTNGTYKLSAT